MEVHVTQTRSGAQFIVDENLVGLRRYLRMLGFDAWGAAGLTDTEILRQAEQSGRLLLTKDNDMRILKSRAQVYFVLSDHSEEQLVEVIRQFQLWPPQDPLARCLACNTLIENLSREEAKPFVPIESFEALDSFFRCPTCKKVFWEGSHFEKMQAWLEKIERRVQGVN